VQQAYDQTPPLERPPDPRDEQRLKLLGAEGRCGETPARGSLSDMRRVLAIKSHNGRFL